MQPLIVNEILYYLICVAGHSMSCYFCFFLSLWGHSSHNINVAGGSFFNCHEDICILIYLPMLVESSRHHPEHFDWCCNNEINLLWSSNDMWRHNSGSILVQVMACCLTAPSHYLYQCWLISDILWFSHEGNFTVKIISVFRIWCKIAHLKLLPHLPGDNETVVA